MKEGYRSYKIADSFFRVMKDMKTDLTVSVSWKNVFIFGNG